NFFIKKMHAKGILAGRDFAFGKDRQRNIPFLKQACAKAGIRLKILPLLQNNQKKIGSSVIRKLILCGHLEEAKKLLGHPYFLIGKVVKGSGKGQAIGFPTANLEIHPSKALPKGVFKACARIDDRHYSAAVNIGTRPTVDPGQKIHVEAHLLSLKKNIYGKTMRLDLLKKIRDEKRFSSLNALREQIAEDIKAANSS
ncbi:MAG: hypothetical protein HY400_06155, partial [Elusimicrobia bacterium]|nr:hypothetical protein [Elusimicrobiota bacterium]